MKASEAELQHRKSKAPEVNLYNSLKCFVASAVHYLLEFNNMRVTFLSLR